MSLLNLSLHKTKCGRAQVIYYDENDHEISRRNIFHKRKICKIEKTKDNLWIIDENHNLYVSGRMDMFEEDAYSEEFVLFKKRIKDICCIHEINYYDSGAWQIVDNTYYVYLILTTTGKLYVMNLQIDHIFRAFDEDDPNPLPDEEYGDKFDSSMQLKLLIDNVKRFTTPRDQTGECYINLKDGRILILVILYNKEIKIIDTKSSVQKPFYYIDSNKKLYDKNDKYITDNVKELKWKYYLKYDENLYHIDKYNEIKLVQPGLKFKELFNSRLFLTSHDTLMIEKNNNKFKELNFNKVLYAYYHKEDFYDYDVENVSYVIYVITRK